MKSLNLLFAVYISLAPLALPGLAAEPVLEHPEDLAERLPEAPGSDTEDAEGGEQHFVLPKPQNNADPSAAQNNLDPNFGAQSKILKGSITASPQQSPLLYGSVQSIPKNTKIDLTMRCYLNSRLSQKGDEVYAEISRDVIAEDGSRVIVPGKWVAHGFVTRQVGERRNGRDGSVSVQFDKIVSPDGQYEVPFQAEYNTADPTLKAVARVVGRDVGYTTVGAAAGGLLGFQVMGLPLTVSTYGINIGVAAGIGATIGLTSALVRKGGVKSVMPGDNVVLKVAEPIEIPGFNQLNLPSAAPKPHVKGLGLRINHYHFGKDERNEDKRVRMLRINLACDNYSDKAFTLRNLNVISDLNVRYPLSLSNTRLDFKIAPKSVKAVNVEFSVDNPKRHYDLILLDDQGAEAARSPINY